MTTSPNFIGPKDKLQGFIQRLITELTGLSTFLEQDHKKQVSEEFKFLVKNTISELKVINDYISTLSLEEISQIMGYVRANEFK